MPTDQPNRPPAIGAVIYRTEDYRRFNWSQFRDNRPMVEKLYEERQLLTARVGELEGRIDAMREEVHSLQLRNQRLSARLGEDKSQSLAIFAIHLVGVIVVGIGINVVTTDSHNGIGWAMIVIFVLLEGIAFMMTRRQGETDDG